jgi:hypothetical protein
MSPGDFNAAFHDVMLREVPAPSCGNRELIDQLLRHDRRRTVVLAAASLICWMIGGAGMILLIVGLNRFVVGVRIQHVLVDQTAAPEHIGGEAASRDAAERFMLGATDLLHHSTPYLAASVAALLLAALLTVLLVFSSRQATLNRINVSLAQISAEVRRLRLPQSSTAVRDGGPDAAAFVTAELPVQHEGRRGSSLALWGAIVVTFLALALVAAAWLLYPRGVRPGIFWSGYPRLSPFEAVQWSGQQPRVRVHGQWYTLRAIDGVPVEQIVSFARGTEPHAWQKRFNEDLVELLTLMGHRPDTVTTLSVDDAAGQPRVLPDVPMTETNRSALLTADLNGTRLAPPPATKP